MSELVVSLFIQILFSNQSVVQGDSIPQSDSIPIGRITYLQQVNLPTDNDRNGNATLYFNASRSLYIHHGVPAKSYSKQTEEFYSVRIAGDPEGFPIYKLHGEHKIFSKIPCYLSKKHCIVEDTLGDVDWIIDPSERRRLGVYECRKAIGKFGGREYESWFTYDIPISSGPFKLGGLPGLILEAYTLDKKVQFLFVSLEISSKLTQLIQVPSGLPVNMSYKEYIKSRNDHSKNVEKEFLAKGFKVSVTPIKDSIELIEDK
ncbi:MAG: GLPGLI family protein [Lewinellaceae bacterium]|jgi:GLPGLI family protein|nr:GLPGLI family protein [Lewinellaceae bacterium]